MTTSIEAAEPQQDATGVQVTTGLQATQDNSLGVDEITFELRDLRAHVNLEAQVLDLVRLNVGADVSLGEVNLRIAGVRAQAMLKVRLDNVVTIIDGVVGLLNEHPEIITALTGGLGDALREVGSGVGSAVHEIGAGTGDAVREIGGGLGGALDRDRSVERRHAVSYHEAPAPAGPTVQPAGPTAARPVEPPAAQPVPLPAAATVEPAAAHTVMLEAAERAEPVAAQTIVLPAAEPAEATAAQPVVRPAAEPAEARAAQRVAPEDYGSGPAVAVEHLQVEHSEAAPRRSTDTETDADAPGAAE